MVVLNINCMQAMEEKKGTTKGWKIGLGSESEPSQEASVTDEISRLVIDGMPPIEAEKKDKFMQIKNNILQALTIRKDPKLIKTYLQQLVVISGRESHMNILWQEVELEVTAQASVTYTLAEADAITAAQESTKFDIQSYYGACERPDDAGQKIWNYRGNVELSFKRALINKRLIEEFDKKIKS